MPEAGNPESYEDVPDCTPYSTAQSIPLLQLWINLSIIIRFVGVQFIKDLGGWESLEMVQRYTRSVSFHDSLKFYKASLS